MLNMYTNGTDFVAAESPTDAEAVVLEMVGGTYAEYVAEYECGAFEIVPDDEMLTFTFEDAPEGEPTKQAQTARQWVTESGRAYIAGWDK